MVDNNGTPLNERFQVSFFVLLFFSIQSFAVIGIGSSFASSKFSPKTSTAADQKIVSSFLTRDPFSVSKLSKISGVVFDNLMYIFSASLAICSSVQGSPAWMRILIWSETDLTVGSVLLTRSHNFTKVLTAGSTKFGSLNRTALFQIAVGYFFF